MTRLQCLKLWFVLAASLPLNAYPQETICYPDEPDQCATALKEGDPAPYDGQLLTFELSDYLRKKAELYEVNLKLEIEYKTKLLQYDLDFERKMRKIDRESFDSERKLLMKRIDRPWYEHPIIIASLTAIVTSAVCIGLSKAMR